MYEFADDIRPERVQENVQIVTQRAPRTWSQIWNGEPGTPLRTEEHAGRVSFRGVLSIRGFTQADVDAVDAWIKGIPSYDWSRPPPECPKHDIVVDGYRLFGVLPRNLHNGVSMCIYDYFEDVK